MALHVCNPSYFGGGELEDLGLRQAQVKSYYDPISSNKLDMVAHTCSSRYS
jgi:hypothetical protein